MSVEEMTVGGNAANYGAVAENAAAKRGAKASVKAGAKENAKAVAQRIGLAARAAVDSVVTLIGAGSIAVGFWMLAERQKDLGYIDVMIAIAVVAGAAISALGIAALVRTIRDRKELKK